MSEIFPESVPDPFLNQDIVQDLQRLHEVYVCSIQVGFPEHRAFELVQSIFLSQMNAAMSSND